MQTFALSEYLPILLFLVIATGIAVVAFALPRFLAPHRPYAEKMSPYECGFEAFDTARHRFDVRF